MNAAACATYHAAPIDPAETEARFRARTLDDPGLREFLLKNGYPADAPFPPKMLDLATLRLIAIYEHPDVAVAVAKLHEAEAAVVTAGERTNPTLTIGPEYSLNPGGVSPWVIGPSLDVTFETAGKRDLQIELAKKQLEVARLVVTETVWRVASRVRPARVDMEAGFDRLSRLTNEVSARFGVAKALKRRLELGDISQFEWSRANAELTKTEAEVSGAESEVSAKEFVFQSVLGLPWSLMKLGATQIVDLLSEPVASDGLPIFENIQRAGLLHRADVRRALAEYAVAELMLQLEIASQYPDIHLSPGYLYDQGQNKFTLGLSFDLPILQKHAGPIAEAEARRKTVAAQFLSTQTAAIQELEAAQVRTYRASERLQKAKILKSMQTKRRTAAARRVAAGEEDRLAIELLNIDVIAAWQEETNAAVDWQMAVAALEDAMQFPLGEGARALPEINNSATEQK